MIALVEGASRQKTPNEIALNILLAVLTIIFLLAVASLQPLAIYSGAEQSAHRACRPSSVCLIPTTIGALLSAIGIAGMDRLVQRNVLAMSGRAVEAAGDVSTLLLDKTGTITLGNRQASELIPVGTVSAEQLADAAQLSSLADETPEGRSIVVLAKTAYGLRERHEGELSHATFVPFTAQTRMSGVDLAVDGGTHSDPQGCGRIRDRVGARAGRRGHRPDRPGSSTASPAPAERRWSWRRATRTGARVLGVVHLKDVVKEGMRERFDELRRDGHPHRDDHRRQPADRARDRRRGRAWTTSSPRRRPRTRWP